MKESIRKRLSWLLPGSDGGENESGMSQAKKITVFTISFLIAVSMWMLINLGRDYSIDVQMPLDYGLFPDDLAPVEPLPDYALASIQGEGWKLINIFNNPPGITVNIEDETQNLFDSAQRSMAGFSDLNLTKVEPMVVNIRMEDRVDKKVPVMPRYDISFRRQFRAISGPDLSPDSVTITGARSLVEGISYWPTSDFEMENQAESFTVNIPLETPPSLVRVEPHVVSLSAEVTEFTEGQRRVPVELSGTAMRREISLSPSFVNVRYDVPVNRYAESTEGTLFRVVVNYSDIEQDTTGYVVPKVEILKDGLNVSVRSIQPRRINYFRQIEQ